MKNLKVLKIEAFCLPMVVFFSSCGIMKNNDFSVQKYTNFKRGESVVNINQTAREKRDDNLYCMVSESTGLCPVLSEKKEEAVQMAVPADESSQTVVASLPEVKNKTGKVVSSNNLFSKKTHKIKPNHATSFLTKRIVNETNRTSSAPGNDPGIVILVILAILLPPIAVLLVKGVGKEFWLDLILTLLFWVPGVVYALFVAFRVK